MQYLYSHAIFFLVQTLPDIYAIKSFLSYVLANLMNYE